MVRVIDDAHLVGLGIADANARLVHDRRRFCRFAGHIGPAVIHSRELHLGLRFSRNDEMPSRKSGVDRTAAFSRTAISICASNSGRATLLSSRFVWNSEPGLFSMSCAASWLARAIR